MQVTSRSLSLLLVVVLTGLPRRAMANAVDDASRYTPGTEGVTRWMSNGHRGDLGFGVWNFEAVANAGSAGRFIGDSTAGAGDINTAGQSFALFAHPPGTPTPFAAAIRRFDQPSLTTGDSVSFKVAVNFRNGNKGFGVRNLSGVEQWNFDVRSGGYTIRNGPSGSPRDDGQQLGGYHANTVFTFTFTQRERQMDWTIVRSGGISSTVSGSFAATSGTLADFRFYVSGTDNSSAQNNLYFNSFVYTPAARGDAPLTPGERRLPGWVPSYTLRYQDPAANSVTVRHSGDGFVTSFPMTKVGEVWELDVRTLGLPPGWHTFKFRPNSEWEADPNRQLYLDPSGRIAQPPAVYLTWQRDPTTTMTVNWFNTSASLNTARYRLPGAPSWSTLTAATQPFPHTRRSIHRAEITGLSPDTAYEFQVDGYEETFRFRTMPAALTRPVKFGVGGDVDVGSTADAMTAAIAARDPDFLVVGGDHAYEDARADYSWRWERYMESFFRNARSPDGRMIPLVVTIGNHEVRYGWSYNHPDFDNTAAWRDRYAPYYFRTFPFPGPATPYGALDFGRYLSLVLGDTEHASPTIAGNDPQTAWLSAALNARRDVTHLIPVYHVTAYPSNRAFSDAGTQRIRQHWVPLFEQAGVKLAFEHHDHTYKATKPLLTGAENSGGIVFLGDGLWGIAPRVPDTSRWYLQTASQQHHVNLVTITATGRTVQSVGADGQLFGGSGPDNVLLSQTIDGIPAVPAPVLSNLTANTLSLSWPAVGNAASYRVLRDSVQIGTTGATAFTDAAWGSNRAAVYQVVALNRSGESSPSAGLSASPRQQWQVANNLPWDGTGAGAATADPDADGWSNLVEFYFGLNPRSPDVALPATVQGDATSVSCLYRRNKAAAGVAGGVVWKTDLRSGAAWSSVGVTDVAVEDDADPALEWRRATVPISPQEGRKFLRFSLQP